MPATTAQQQPAVPPRPAKSQDTPKVPPRPARRPINRSVSPSRDRFAPSPLNEAQFLAKSPNATVSFPRSNLSVDPIDRSGSVELPSLGEEGREYAAMAEELKDSARSSSPEQKRTVGDDIKLHAPKPSLPASSAKRQVAVVTHTDSDKAAAYGIGRASSDGPSPPYSIHKRGSTASQELSDDLAEDDEHGIPEIGRQVPMYPNAGDVQAPSPALGTGDSEHLPTKSSSHKPPRSFGVLPPGSYGLHGHGVVPSDKLEKQYYEKHPELVRKEHHSHHSDRAKDFSRTSDELNKIVRETAAHGAGIGTHDLNGTPSEQVGWQAIQESTSRPASVKPKAASSSFGSESSATASVLKTAAPEISVWAAPEDPDIIHVDEPNHRKSVMFEDAESPDLELEDEAPILALDEVAKDPSAYDHPPAVEPPIERRPSSFEADEPSSRPTSRPSSIFKGSHIAKDEAAVADQEEYEPLFPKDDDKKTRPALISSQSFQADEAQARFPSRDIWEDAPSSTYYTAEVEAPDVPAESNPTQESDVAPREGETPAQAFARRQEELAEKELQGSDAFLENRKPRKTALWAMQNPELAQEAATAGGASPLAGLSTPAGSSDKSGSHRPAMAQRFPSRDVWEDSPDSLQLETTVSDPQEEEATASPAESTKPSIPQRPTRKLTDPSEKAVPVVPSRPKSRSPVVGPTVVAATAAAATAAVAAGAVAAEESSSSTSAKPVVPGRPKPHVPSRPVKQSPADGADKESEAASRAKPAIPARAMGGKIAQLQASFMSDLNKKLKIGPQAPKKDEPVAAAEEAKDEVEKAPLVDARKGRARGPQRRAPRSSPSPAAFVNAAAASAPVSTSAAVSLGFSTTTTLYSIDPDGVLDVAHEHIDEPVATAVVEKITEPEKVEKVEKEEPQETVEKAEVKAEVPVAEEKTEEESVEAAKETTGEEEAAEKPETLVAETTGEVPKKAVVDAVAPTDSSDGAVVEASHVAKD